MPTSTLRRQSPAANTRPSSGRSLEQLRAALEKAKTESIRQGATRETYMLERDTLLAWFKDEAEMDITEPLGPQVEAYAAGVIEDAETLLAEVEGAT